MNEALKFKRVCSVCGQEFEVEIASDGKILTTNVGFFGEVTIDPVTKVKVEYWECEKCLKKMSEDDSNG